MIKKKEKLQNFLWMRTRPQEKFTMKLVVDGEKGKLK